MHDSITNGYHSIRCPFCEVYELEPSGHGDDSTHCPSCRLSLDGVFLKTLRQITQLPDALGSHPCEECSHPEMRRLGDGVSHCPACGAEVLPVGSSDSSSGFTATTEAYRRGWADGLFGSTQNFTRNYELARWEDVQERLDYYRGHRAGRETRQSSGLLFSERRGNRISPTYEDSAQ